MQRPSTTSVRVEISVLDEAGTVRVARALAHVAGARDILALHGDLGSGKTAFARGFVRALTRADEEVPSPTFTLAQTYPVNGLVIHHFDFYRIESPDDAWEIGVEEAFADGIALIEWPERVAGILPADRLDVYLEASPDGSDTARRIVLSAGPSWERRLEDIGKQFAKVTDA